MIEAVTDASRSSGLTEVLPVLVVANGPEF
jgi:hypothetical protein